MKKLILMLALAISVSAQSPSTNSAVQPKPDLAIPPPAIQAEVAQASKNESDALAAYQTAIRATREALFKAMAEASIKPSDCAADGKEFACIRSVKEGIAFERKKAEAAKVNKP